MKHHERKIKNIQNQRIQQLITNLSKKIESDNADILKDLDKKAQKSKEEEKPDHEPEPQRREPQKLSPFSKIYYRICEFFLCFVYSFFPTWYIELYIEEQTESYKQIVKQIRNQPKVEEVQEKKMDELNKKLITQTEKDQKEEEKKSGEEVKEEDSIDPTDNINPENYKLIQKLQNLHKIEVLKEGFTKEKENEDDDESNEGSSKNSEPLHNSEYRNKEKDLNTQEINRSQSFEIE